MQILIKTAPKIMMLAMIPVMCFSQPQDKTETSKVKKMTQKANALVCDDIVIGTGQTAKVGDNVEVHYTGTLMNGKKFDSSHDRGKPFHFTLGIGQVIQGWDEGVVGMKVGGKRKLTIPSEMGYGEWGAGASIPPHSDLQFEVELLGTHSEKNEA